MEKLLHDHNLLREKLNSHRNHSEDRVPDFSYELILIDAWETGALAQMRKIIRAEAERAREVIRHITRENQHLIFLNNVALSEELDRLKNLLTVLGKQLQARMETMDYLESDLRQWQTQLKDISESSLASSVQLPHIINKIYIGETRQTQIDVSNVLGIVYVDKEGNRATVNSSEENDLMQATKGYESEGSDYTNRRYRSTLCSTHQAPPRNHFFYFRRSIAG